MSPSPDKATRFSTKPQVRSGAKDTREAAFSHTLEDKVHLERVLSEEDVQKARQAIDFLDDVRAAAQEASRAENLSKEDLPEYIGRYRIVRSLGRGGFAEVFLAEDESLKRHVALKIPLVVGSIGSEYCSRFEREARAAAMLSHPSIVPVYEFDCFGPVAFIAYRWYRGTNLASWLTTQGGRVPPQAAARMVARIAEGIAHAHQRGVIHRDLKPANILVDADGMDAGKPMPECLLITDFGLARHMDADQESLTQEGAALGTPSYMSPEQAMGSRDTAAATDIWSLGVILYELLTGEVPFRRAGTLATLKAIEQESPLPMRMLNPGVPKELIAICDHCLEKLPGERYESAFQLASDLDAWLHNRRISVRKESPIYAAWRWARRNRALAMWMGIAVLSLCAGLALALWKWHESSVSRNAAERESRRAEQHLSELMDVVDRMLVDFERSDEPTALSTEQRERLQEIFTLQRQLIDRESDDPSVRRNTLRALVSTAKISALTGEFERATTCSADLREWMGPPESWQMTEMNHDDLVRLMELCLVETTCLLRSGRPAEALQAVAELDDMLEIFQNELLPRERISLQMSAANGRGLAYKDLRQLDESLRVFVEGNRLARELAASGNLQTDEVCIAARILSNLAGIYSQKGDTAQAENIHMELFSLLVPALAENPDTIPLRRLLAIAHSNFSKLLTRVGRMEEAEVQSDLAIDAFRDLVDDVPSNISYVESLASALNEKTAALLLRREVEAASEVVDQIMELGESGLKLSLKGRVMLATTLRNMASVYTNNGNHAEAEDCVRDAKVALTAILFQAPGYYRAQVELFNVEVAIISALERQAKYMDLLEELPMAYEAGIALRGAESGTTNESYVITTLGWMVRMEAFSLAKLARWNEALSVSKDVALLKGRLTDNRRGCWKEGALAIVQVIKLGSNSDAFTAEEVAAARVDALDLMARAIEAGQVKSRSDVAFEPFKSMLHPLPEFESLMQDLD